MAATESRRGATPRFEQRAHHLIEAEGVEPGPGHSSRVEGLPKRLFVQDFPARGVQHKGARLDQAELAPPQQPVLSACVQGDHVGPPMGQGRPSFLRHPGQAL